MSGGDSNTRDRTKFFTNAYCAGDFSFGQAPIARAARWPRTDKTGRTRTRAQGRPTTLIARRVSNGSKLGMPRYTIMRLQPLIILLLISSVSTAAAQERGIIVPGDWIEEARTSSSAPLRFISPDGRAWATMYATPAEGRGLPRAALPRKGERVTYRRVTPRFVAIAGVKGSNGIFYRKSNLACGGTRWHHIALEYPEEDRRKMDPVVTRMAHGMNRYDADCAASKSRRAG